MTGRDFLLWVGVAALAFLLAVGLTIHRRTRAAEKREAMLAEKSMVTKKHLTLPPVGGAREAGVVIPPGQTYSLQYPGDSITLWVQNRSDHNWTCSGTAIDTSPMEWRCSQ